MFRFLPASQLTQTGDPYLTPERRHVTHPPPECVGGWESWLLARLTFSEVTVVSAGGSSHPSPPGPLSQAGVVLSPACSVMRGAP